MDRTAIRDMELDIIADAPEEIRPLLLVCPKCHETEPIQNFVVEDHAACVLGL